MSAHMAVLIAEISPTWLKDVFAVAVGALVLLALFIVFP
jgi:hypothetical protein